MSNIENTPVSPVAGDRLDESKAVQAPPPNIGLNLPDYLPGLLLLERGNPSDYALLEQFHYLPKRPATWAGVWRIRFEYKGDSRIVAVGVLSFPAARCLMREQFLGRSGHSFREHLLFANEHIRTISRVVVHPQFRSIGLSTVLVRCLIRQCSTRYVDALAQMGRAHPFFEKAGMKRIEPANEKTPVYFICDKARLIPAPLPPGERLS